MGIWFFSSRLAGSEYTLVKALGNLDVANDLLRNFGVNIRNLNSNCLARG